jgi:glutamate dehydrogenase (NAD(P)+)
MGPDMGTDEECMAWIKDEIGNRVTGLPAEAGGIPIDQIGATAWGIRHAIEVALPYGDFPEEFNLAQARVAVQGFGAVGKNAARFLADQGAVLVGAADSQGSVYDPDGLDLDKLIEVKDAGKSVVDYPDAQKMDRDAIVGFDCDIWIPAARPDVVNEENMHNLKAKLVVEGANIPVTEGAEKYLHEKGILCIPDFIANAGGVICAAMEYRGKIESEAMAVIQDKIRTNTRLVLEESRIKKILPREAAMNLAVARVEKAMSYKRWSIY